MNDETVHPVVKTERLEIVDSAGRMKACLATTDTAGTGLLMYDDTGSVRATLHVGSDGSPSFILHDANGKPQAVFSITPGGVGIRIDDESRHRITIGWEKTAKTAVVALFDQDGNLAESLSSAPR